MSIVVVFVFKRETAYEMRISDWSSDVCSSDLLIARELDRPVQLIWSRWQELLQGRPRAPAHILMTSAIAKGEDVSITGLKMRIAAPPATRSEEHTSELQSLMRISYAVFCLKKKNTLMYTTDIVQTYVAQTNNTYK